MGKIKHSWCQAAGHLGHVGLVQLGGLMRQIIFGLLAALLFPGFANATPTCVPDPFYRVFSGPIALTSFAGASTDPADGNFFELRYVPCLGETQLTVSNLYEWRVTLLGQNRFTPLWSEAVVFENKVNTLLNEPRTASFSFNDPGESAFSFVFNPLVFDIDVDFAYFNVGDGLVGYDIFTGSIAPPSPEQINLVAIPFANNAFRVPNDIDGFWTPTFSREIFPGGVAPSPVPVPASGFLLIAACGAAVAFARCGRASKVQQKA